ncbi:MAG: hypothetical protein FJY67_06255 [Calditrichaeota bacterium]|nr:hypothetical protein [Calditrichota bacterium]
MITYDPNCPLCRLARDGEVLTPLHYEDEQLIVVDCLVCRTPMAVLKAHQSAFNPTDRESAKRILGQLLSNGIEVTIPVKFRRFHGDADPLWIIDWEQRQIPDHPHCHLRPWPFPGTSQWEPLVR